jgi:hypothetical protein
MDRLLRSSAEAMSAAKKYNLQAKIDVCPQQV